MDDLTDERTSLRYLDRAGVRIAYRDLGDKADPPVVLLHGLFSSGRSWDVFAARLVGEGHRVVIVDLRGHGRSSKAATYRFTDFAEDLIAVLDELDLQDVDLVGHSLGGHTVSLVAQQQASRVRRLVIEDAPPPPIKGDRYRGPGLAALPARSRALLVGALIVRFNKVRKYVDLSMARAVLREFRRRDPEWWAALRTITAPTLLLWGGSTSHVPGHRLEEIATLIPTSELITIDVGHRVHNNQPEEFARIVLDFLHS